MINNDEEVDMDRDELENPLYGLEEGCHVIEQLQVASNDVPNQ